MLEFIIDNLYAKSAVYFGRLIPFAEQVQTGAKIVPMEYLSKGNYKPIDADNFAGIGYFRQLSELTISDVESKSHPNNDLKKYTYSLRLVGCAKKDSVLKKDDSFSGDALSMTIARALQETNGSLRMTLGAKNVQIKIGTISTNPKKIITDEFQVESLKKGIPADFCMVAIDLIVEVEITASCVNIICDTNCTYASVNPMERVFIRTGFRMVYPKVVPVASQYTYNVPELNGRRIEWVALGGFFLPDTAYSYTYPVFTFTNPADNPIFADTDINIAYT